MSRYRIHHYKTNALQQHCSFFFKPSNSIYPFCCTYPASESWASFLGSVLTPTIYGTVNIVLKDHVPAPMYVAGQDSVFEWNAALFALI